jgi:predicted O-methyltransferase YrrM
MYNFYQTKILKNINEYAPMRVNVELVILYYLIRYFNCNEILEIGFYEGLTFGTLIEAASKNSRLTAVDINFRSEMFNKYYSDNLPDKTINLIKINSNDFDSKQTYDFIHVDGNHSYPQAFNDIKKAITLLEKTGILMIDDYEMPGVDQSIDEIMRSTELVPFMISEQASWWHYPEHNASDFLDNILDHTFSSFCMLPNIDYKSHMVKKVKCLPAITNNNNVFTLICKEYKI